MSIHDARALRPTTLTRIVATTLAALGAVLAACSSDDPGPREQPAPEVVPSGAVGASCLFSYSCPAGSFCDLKRCVRTCDADAPCGDGLVCTPRGRCSADGTDPGDPAPTTSAGILTTPARLLTVATGDASVTVRLEGAGRVRFRLESDADWLVPDTASSAFEGAVDVRVPIDRSKLGGERATATLRVVSTQGDLFVVVRARPSVQAVWRGALAFRSVLVDQKSTPLDLGETSFDLHVRNDAGDLRAQVDPATSTLWPATKSGPATGKGTVEEDGTFTFVLEEKLDDAAAAPLYPAESASVLRAKDVVRELTLKLRLGDDGALAGSAVERIHGLTSTPIELAGTATFSADATAALAMFEAPAPIAKPSGPVRDPGAAPPGCPPPIIPGCASESDSERWSCLIDDAGVLARGYALSNFYAPGSTRAPVFSFTPENTAGASTPYAVVGATCAAELPGDMRADQAGPASTCIDLGAMACARYYSATAFTARPELEAQGSMYVGRAYMELFGMLGNEALVQAATRRLSSTATMSEIRSLWLKAHALYDAGLYRVFDPRLLEELRAVGASDAQMGPMAPVAKNDRAALRLAASAVERSDAAARQAFAIDLVTATDIAAMRGRAQASAALRWLEVALLADLDARWRGEADAVPEVASLGAMMRKIEQTVAATREGATPLGIARAYVPLLARTSSADVKTNFERLFEIAGSSVTKSIAADATARDSQRSFDRDATLIGQALTDEIQAVTGRLGTICGSDFIAGGAPKKDIEACGRTSGSARGAVLASETALLELQSAQQALAAQHEIYRTRTETYAAIHQVKAEHIAFIEKTGKKILDIAMSQYRLQAAAGILAGVGAVSSPWTLAPAIAGGVSHAAAASMSPAQFRLMQMQQVASLKVDQEITDLKNAQDLYETALQFAQLDTQVAIKLSELARAYGTIVSAREEVAALLATYEKDVAALARTGSFDADPSFRIERNADAVDADVALEQGKRDLYLATRALEYETNTDLSKITDLVFLAPNASQLQKTHACVANAWNQWRLLVSSTNTYVTEVSLAKDVLDIRGPIEDATTGATLDEGTQLRRFLFDQPYAPDESRVWPAIRLGTTLNRTSGLFSSLVCNDRIRSIEVKLVGAGLAGGRAEVQILADGSSKLRACAATATEEALVSWNLRPEGQLAPAVVSAGINDYDTASSPNQSLLDYAVAQDTLIVSIPDAASSPANKDLDPAKIDDVVLRITHTGVATGSATGSFHPTCN